MVERRHTHSPQTFGHLPGAAHGATRALDGAAGEGLGIVDELCGTFPHVLRLQVISHPKRKGRGRGQVSLRSGIVREPNTLNAADCIVARSHVVFELDPVSGIFKLFHLPLPTLR
ncbi:hypothetical protein D3C71_1578340 [compost metagenome]